MAGAAGVQPGPPPSPVQQEVHPGEQVLLCAGGGILLVARDLLLIPREEGVSQVVAATGGKGTGVNSCAVEPARGLLALAYAPGGQVIVRRKGEVVRAWEGDGRLVFACFFQQDALVVSKGAPLSTAPGSTPTAHSPAILRLDVRSGEVEMAAASEMPPWADDSARAIKARGGQSGALAPGQSPRMRSVLADIALGEIPSWATAIGAAAPEGAIWTVRAYDGFITLRAVDGASRIRTNLPGVDRAGPTAAATASALARHREFGASRGIKGAKLVQSELVPQVLGAALLGKRLLVLAKTPSGSDTTALFTMDPTDGRVTVFSLPSDARPEAIMVSGAGDACRAWLSPPLQSLPCSDL